MRLRPSLLLALLVVSFGLSAQEVIPPLDIPLYLSGNFGELRHNHFHSGIDFKTQGKTGIPVKAVKSGHIYRIAVSPYGYGRAVYIDHQDGTSSVYGHLDRFTKGIEQAVRDSQYIKESFAVNLFFAPEQFPLNQGEVFAYSGNTGGSGGPHLHFEFRTTDEDKPYDPLPYFKGKVKDKQAPEIRGLMAFPVEGQGVVNGKDSKQALALKKDKSGKQFVSTQATAWGKIGIGIKAYDRMSETSNIYGVSEILLKVDGNPVYHTVMDAFSFDDTRYLNSYIDWTEWIENKSFYMKSFTDPGNFLGLNRCPGDGIIHINEERPYRIEYVLSDVYGNTNRLKFTITGKETTIPEKLVKGERLYYNRDNNYQAQGIDFHIPRGNLYTNTDVVIDTAWNKALSPYAPVYTIGKRIPLHKYCSLILDIPNDTYPDKSKYGIVSLYKESKNWLGGEYKGGSIQAKFRELGTFLVVVDDTPPAISPVNEAKWTTSQRLSFKITDDLSGIDRYRGTLDGAFILFEYDAKRNALFTNFDSKRMKKGRQQLELVVSDAAGNEARFSKEIVF